MILASHNTKIEVDVGQETASILSLSDVCPIKWFSLNGGQRFAFDGRPINLGQLAKGYSHRIDIFDNAGRFVNSATVILSRQPQVSFLVIRAHLFFNKNLIFLNRNSSDSSQPRKLWPLKRTRWELNWTLLMLI